MGLISLLKTLPVDIGQGGQQRTTAGKRIAFSLVPRGTKSARALDIGCRDGYWSERFKALGYETSSLDIEPHYEGAMVHDVEKGLPFPDNSFDLSWCSEVVEHLHNPHALVREVNRVMRPGGVSLFTTPNSAFWLYWVFKLWGWTPRKVQNPDHKQFFTLESIKELADSHELSGYFPYFPPFARLRNHFLIGLLSPTFVLYKKH